MRAGTSARNRQSGHIGHGDFRQNERLGYGVAQGFDGACSIETGQGKGGKRTDERRGELVGFADGKAVIVIGAATDTGLVKKLNACHK